jgi:hypothetical protein
MNTDQVISFLVAGTGALATVLTAVATYFLFRVTRVLAVETKRMAEASAQPHVVATLVPNRWSLNYFDINVDNTGNATAYDIAVHFDPPLTNGKGRSGNAIPFQRLSVLKPGQGLSSYLCEFAHLKGNVYQVKITWRKAANASEIQSNIYTLSMNDHSGISRLGNDPLLQLASSLKHIDERLSPVLRGSVRLKVDSFSSDDRQGERDRDRRAVEEVRKKNLQDGDPSSGKSE